MALETGVAKRLTFKEETSWGVAAGSAGAQRMRRVTSSFELKKDTYQSGEIRSDYQVSDFRHGVRSVVGSISGELSAKTYGNMFEALLRRDFATVTALTALSVTISGSGPTYTVARAAGDFLTGGVKVGDVVRLSVGTFNAANINKNLVVTAVTALNFTCYPMNGVAMVAEGPIASGTLSWVGKKTFVPVTGHTDLSFSIEQFYATVAQSELFVGCKVNSADVELPSTGMAKASFSLLGKDVVTGTAEYFTSPTAETTTTVVSAVSGRVFVAGAPVAIITDAKLSIVGGQTPGPALGTNSVVNIFPGKVAVTGTLSVYFQDATYRNLFINETEASIILILADGETATADFVSFVLPRVKMGSNSKSDGEQAIIESLSFQALLNTAGGTGIQTEKTTLSMQDSQM